MTEATKVVNYSDEVVAVMVEQYEAAPTQETVEQLAARFDKTVASIRAKLSSKGVYKAKVRATKTGGVVVSKASLVAVIEAFVGSEVGTLVKANKADLEKVVARIAVVSKQMEAQ